MILTINDLRVGNAFVQKGSNFVEFATIQDLVAISEGRKIVEGVPLTEGWLIRFGFEFRFLHERIKIYSLGEFQYRDSRYKRGLTHRKLGVLRNKIHYVHELQNLHYALTKRELPCS